jgi:hypothetical protein
MPRCVLRQVHGLQHACTALVLAWTHTARGEEVPPVDRRGSFDPLDKSATDVWTARRVCQAVAHLYAELQIVLRWCFEARDEGGINHEIHPLPLLIVEPELLESDGLGCCGIVRVVKTTAALTDRCECWGATRAQSGYVLFVFGHDSFTRRTDGSFNQQVDRFGA